jgi:hypothetical protein
MTDVTANYARELPALPYGWSWRITRQTGYTVVEMLRDGLPTSYYGEAHNNALSRGGQVAGIAEALRDHLLNYLPPPTPVELARWLAHHTPAIAALENAADTLTKLKTLVDRIDCCINRPEPTHRYLGPCPALLNDNYGQRVCNTELTAPPDNAEIQCPTCKTTHNINQLRQQHLDNTDQESFTIRELHQLILPALRIPIPLRTLQHWAATSKLVPTGYVGDEPRYQLAHVRQLHEAKPQKNTTGAAARKAKP